MKKTIMIGTLLFFAGCASEKQISAVDSVQGQQDSVDKTNDYVAKAEKSIDEFQKNIHELMKEAAASDKMRGKGKYNEALSSLDRRVAISKRNLNHLRGSNNESWEAYKARLDSAKEDMSDSLDEKSE